MASAAQQNGEGRAMVVNGNLDDAVNGTASTSLDWEEFEVNIGWGTMRGKIRGKGPRLMLGVHGWLDNANTFDLLAPHLPKDVRFLSLDLPGHGRSDHFPPGFIYDPRGYMGAIRKTVMAIGWKRFIYLGHSMGAVVGIMYAATFPEDVAAFISIDIIKVWSLTPEKQPAAMKKYFLQLFDNEDKASQPALVYKEEELVRRTMDGSRSLDERGARILLQRGARRVEGGTGLMLTRDLRVKAYFIGFITLDEWVEMARAITSPTLICKASEGHEYEKKDPEGLKAMLEGFKQGCQHFRYYDIQGKHHIHLTAVDAVANPITRFLDSIKELGHNLG